MEILILILMVAYLSYTFIVTGRFPCFFHYWKKYGERDGLSVDIRTGELYPSHREVMICSKCGKKK